jgi:predicted 3-demethylubiquinone-9 3-methyltransferase (glyoxalase superfamily)
MPARVQRITPCLWFDDQGEEAAQFYCAIFPNSRVGKVSRYGKEGREIHGKPEGSAMSVEFELDGQAFTAINGGPDFKFTEAISFQVHCETQEEVDHYWERLLGGNGAQPQQCGWLKDRYGVSWQVIPQALIKLVSDPASEKSQRAMKAMLQMQKIDIAALRRAYDGTA